MTPEENNASFPSELQAPAPWYLTGNGYILLYRFSKNFIEKNGFLTDSQILHYKGIIGATMLVDYQTSGVGPYQELLFIPGLFEIQGKRMFSITKIYVSTYNSVWNGIENWGIPKELAFFNWKTEPSEAGSETITIRVENRAIFEATFQKSWFKFPLTTALTPIKIAQQLRDHLVITSPSAKGKGQWTKLLSIKTDPQYFPDLAQVKPLAVIAVNDFKMVFPVAEGLGQGV